MVTPGNNQSFSSDIPGSAEQLSTGGSRDMGSLPQGSHLITGPGSVDSRGTVDANDEIPWEAIALKGLS